MKYVNIQKDFNIDKTMMKLTDIENGLSIGEFKLNIRGEYWFNAKPDVVYDTDLLYSIMMDLDFLNKTKTKLESNGSTR